MKTIREYIGNNSYPGRGILVGMTADGTKAVVGYFIMRPQRKQQKQSV